MSVDPGQRPELTWLPVDRLSVDDAYQRSLNTPRSKKLIARIAEHFRWASFQAILATPAGADAWLIIDGQHRVAAARQVGLSLVPAVIIHGVTVADQAAAFVTANRDRVPVSAQELFHARLAAGDEAARLVKRACDDAGIRLLPYTIGLDFAPIGSTPAVAALLYCLKKHGEICMRGAVAAVGRYGASERGGLRSEFFVGASLYLFGGGNPEELNNRIDRLGGIAGLRKIALGVGAGTNSKAAQIASALGRFTSGPRVVAGLDRARLMAGR